MDAPRVEISQRERLTSAITESTDQSVQAKLAGGKFRWIAILSAFLLVLLATLAVLLILMKGPSTVDQLVILTVPSGAEIHLDSRPLGPSPIKLEGVRVGTHTLTITKEGFESIDESISIVDSGPVERRLKPNGEPGGLSIEERIRQYTNSAEEALRRNEYGIPYDSSALYYAEQIKLLDGNNQFALDLIETIRKILFKNAQEASLRGDLALAQDYYAVLVDHYPTDDVAKTAALKLEGQLVAKRGEIRELLRRAEEAWRVGNFFDEEGSSYFYAKQAIARDRHNAQARTLLDRLKNKLTAAGEGAWSRGDLDAALKNFEQAVHLFPDDKLLRPRIRDIEGRRSAENRRGPDAATRRVQGLEKYSRGEFAEAISDLKYAIDNGAPSGPDVLFALGRSYQKLHQLDVADYYLLRVGASAPDAHPSAVAARGDIAMERGETQTALSHYREALSLGGSTLYPVADLEEKVARIEARQQQEKSPEPTPISVKVKHLHGGILKGSCSGMLAVSSTGIRFDGGEHTFASNLVGVGVLVEGAGMTVKFQGKSEKFSLSQTEANRFKDMLSRFQAAASANK